VTTCHSYSVFANRILFPAKALSGAPLPLSSATFFSFALFAEEA
jgi:hypothetical protein